MKIEFEKDIAYHCTTLEEAEFILTEAQNQNITWSEGKDTTCQTFWNEERDKCYYIYKSISHSNGTFYSTNNNHKIIEVGDLMNSQAEIHSLPKYWIVKNDGSDEYKNIVIKYLQKFHNWEGSDINNYYGFDGGDRYRGSFDSRNIKDFHNTPTILTLEEFKQCINGKQITKTIKNKKKNENTRKEGIKICRPIVTITRGPEIRGNSISGRASKIKFTIGHLSNQAIYF